MSDNLLDMLSLDNPCDHCGDPFQTRDSMGWCAECFGPIHKTCMDDRHSEGTFGHATEEKLERWKAAQR